MNKISTIEGARAFVEEAVARLGVGFHPDTPASDYALPGGELVFAPEEAAEFDANLSAAFTLLGNEIYEIGHAAQQRLLR